MNSEILESKINSALEILDERVSISSGENIYDEISMKLNYIPAKTSPQKYLLMIVIVVMGLFSGVYLGININENKKTIENKAEQVQSDDTYPLEKIIMGKDYN